MAKKGKRQTYRRLYAFPAASHAVGGIVPVAETTNNSTAATGTSDTPSTDNRSPGHDGIGIDASQLSNDPPLSRGEGTSAQSNAGGGIATATENANNSTSAATPSTNNSTSTAGAENNSASTAGAENNRTAATPSTDDEWLPRHDGIDASQPSILCPVALSRDEDINAHIRSVLYGPSEFARKKRLPEFEKFCPE